LANFLVEELNYEHDVSGAWRTPKHGFETLTNVVEYKIGESLPISLEKSYDLIIWLYPPAEDYKKTLSIADEFFDQSIPWIFTSSTSVYESGVIDENSKRTGKKFRGENLIEIEDLLLSFKRSISIVRPSGLVDKKRNPSNFFKNTSKILPLKGEVTNLVHTMDVARFIKFLISNKNYGDHFNLSSKKNYEKSFFYNELQKITSSKELKFSESILQEPKIINSHKSRSIGFEYKYENLLDYFLNLDF